MESTIVKIHKDGMTDYAKINCAIEIAFNAFVDEARKLGLPVAHMAKLMYLPTLQVTANFQDACRAVLADLKPDPRIEMAEKD